ncbi:adenine deaminase [Albidovulum sediminis]|uniref:Adenine deaminase n=1 Tax=Albidovulum sediminis TaxID=3066345 RepID=A0ABT2NT19_9RHOB|nr:adenine deaminase [Defluviimonas sediminis]MCT8331079.1 adenine deaminase [Defluviimonas sediminis]
MKSQNLTPRPWSDVAPRLVAVAAGRAPADRVIRGGQWVNVHTREILPGHDVAIAEGRFAAIAPDLSYAIGPETEVIEAQGRYMVPGLCDGHMHVESGMLTPAEFAAAVIPHGTTTMFADPHEIANVLGIEGVRMMHDEALMQPVSMFMQMPSCAPSAPGLETTPYEIGPDEVTEAMAWPGIVGLGEMMNFPGVIAGSQQMLAEIAATQRAGKTVGGHYASPDLGPAFLAYAAGGPADDHEGTTEMDPVVRARQGMRAMMRHGSAWFDVDRQITAVTEKGLDPRNFILCTDDCHPGTLVEEGHMDRAYRRAVEKGCDPLVALQMCTINTATHFGLERELGSITPGRRADLILTSDLRTLPCERVIARGRTVAENGRLTVTCPHYDWPAHARDTVRMGRDKTADDFVIRAPEGAATVRVRVIGIVENQAPTRALTAELAVQDGIVEPDEGQDVAQCAVIERHQGSGQTVNGFVNGFRYKGRMAMASTVAHDSHQIIVVGTDRGMMAEAANSIAKMGGGFSLWKDGREIADIPLPVAGLMSDAPAAEMAAKASNLVTRMRDCGCDLNNASIQHSFLALVVIPELRISDLGLVDVTRFEFTELFA